MTTMTMSAEEFARELFLAPIAEELKKQVLEALPTMSSGKVERIYRILKQTRVKREQELLKLDVHCSEALKGLQEAVDSRQ